MQAKCSDVRLRLSLSFLEDTFGFVNSINLTLQGREITVLHCHEKLTAFKMMLKLWDSKLEKKSVAPFPQLNTDIDTNELNVDDDILEVKERHVSILREETTHYFPDLEVFEEQHRFINNPFVFSINDLPSEDNLINEQSIDFINEGGAKHVFREM